MKRRTFMAGAAAATLAPVMAKAMGSTAYTPGLVDKELAAGKTVFVDFTTTWCTTCAAQKRAMAELIEENPAYAEAITFITVDFDDYRDDELTRRLGVNHRSTLIVLKGDEVLGRNDSDPRKASIKVLMDTALGAATA